MWDGRIPRSASIAFRYRTFLGFFTSETYSFPSAAARTAIDSFGTSQSGP